MLPHPFQRANHAPDNYYDSRNTQQKQKWNHAGYNHQYNTDTHYRHTL
jgi:predicted RNA-binding protein with PUA-like domain